MFEIFSGGLLGSIFGGIFRLAPEVLKWLDKKMSVNMNLPCLKINANLKPSVVRKS